MNELKVVVDLVRKDPKTLKTLIKELEASYQDNSIRHLFRPEWTPSRKVVRKVAAGSTHRQQKSTKSSRASQAKALVTTLALKEENRALLQAWAENKDSVLTTFRSFEMSSFSEYSEVFTLAERITETTSFVRILLRFACIALLEAARAAHYHDGERHFFRGAKEALARFGKIQNEERLAQFVQLGCRYRRLATMLGGCGALLVLPEEVPDWLYSSMNLAELQETAEYLCSLGIKDIARDNCGEQIAEHFHCLLATQLPLFTLTGVTGGLGNLRQRSCHAPEQTQTSINRGPALNEEENIPEKSQAGCKGLGSAFLGDLSTSSNNTTTTGPMPLHGHGDALPDIWAVEFFDALMTGHGDQVPITWSSPSGSRTTGYEEETSSHASCWFPSVDMISTPFINNGMPTSGTQDPFLQGAQAVMAP